MEESKDKCYSTSIQENLIYIIPTVLIFTAVSYLFRNYSVLGQKNEQCIRDEVTSSKSKHHKPKRRFARRRPKITNPVENEKKLELCINRPPSVDHLLGQDISADHRLSSSEEENHFIRQESYDLETECKEPYAKAVIEVNSLKDFEKALKYIHLKGSFCRNSDKIMYAIEHIHKLEQRATNLNIPCGQNGFPKEYTQKEINNVCEFEKIRNEDMQWIVDRLKTIHGFPPTPSEVVELYQETIERDSFKKKMDHLEDVIKQLGDRIKDDKNAIERLKMEKVKLELECDRHKCKCCRERDVSVVYEPCQHAVYCGQCSDRLSLKSKKKLCPICQWVIKKENHFYLS